MLKNDKGIDFCGIKNPHDISLLKEEVYRHLLIFQGRDPELVGSRDIHKAPAIGILDGASIEIREEVGGENMFIFGMTADEVAAEKAGPRRNPRDIHASDEGGGRMIDSIKNGSFIREDREDREEFRPLADTLPGPNDPCMLLRDFEDYVRCRKEAAAAFEDRCGWRRRPVPNAASIGRSSADRTVLVLAEHLRGIAV